MKHILPTLLTVFLVTGTGAKQEFAHMDACKKALRTQYSAPRSRGKALGSHCVDTASGEWYAVKQRVDAVEDTPREEPEVTIGPIDEYDYNYVTRGSI